MIKMPATNKPVGLAVETDPLRPTFC